MGLIRRDEQRPAYLWMLAGIIALYAVIIVLGNTDAGGLVRVFLLGGLVWSAARLRTEPSVRRTALVVSGVAIVAAVIVTLFASSRILYGVIGACAVVLIAVAATTIGASLRGRLIVDIVTVLGVLCIYLLFALFFAGLHQLLGAFIPEYLNGTGEFATPSDLLYFSSVTLSTVGFGDITPAAQVARAVTVVEALVGQLYLVSVVAGVVGGWRPPQAGEPRS
jgi:hypothetical protein